MRALPLPARGPQVPFRRQEPLGPYFADFACTAARLVIEIDGDSHTDRAQADEHRRQWLAKNGYRVIRFGNRDVVDNIEGVLQEIRMACARR